MPRPLPWTAAEDAVLLAALNETGGYARAAQRLPGRTEDACRTHAMDLRRAKAAQEAREKRPCLRCGVPFDRKPGRFVCDGCKKSDDWRMGWARA